MPAGVPNATALKPAFTFAEALVKRRFREIRMRPEQGDITVGPERVMLLRADTLYVSFFDALTPLLGERGTIDLIYTVARETGRTDARAFIDALKPSHTATKVASGLSHMAFTGFASVEVHMDSIIADDDTFFLHYSHPNTIEAEALKARGKKSARAACHFTGGYFAGWCTESLNMHLHAKEVLCSARGDERCELIIAQRHKLEEHHRRLRALLAATPAPAAVASLPPGMPALPKR